jgi:hypothetical protein
MPDSADKEKRRENQLRGAPSLVFTLDRAG